MCAGAREGRFKWGNPHRALKRTAAAALAGQGSAAKSPGMMASSFVKMRAELLVTLRGGFGKPADFTAGDRRLASSGEAR